MERYFPHEGLDVYAVWGFCQKFYEKYENGLWVCEFVGVWVGGSQRGQAFQRVACVP